MEWSASSIIFRLDGSHVGTTYFHNEPAFQQPHYFILNLAQGGNFYGNPLKLTNGTASHLRLFATLCSSAQPARGPPALFLLIVDGKLAHAHWHGVCMVA